MYPYHKPLLFFLTFKKYFNIGVCIDLFGHIGGQQLFMKFGNTHNRDVLLFYSALSLVEKTKLIKWYSSLVGIDDRIVGGDLSEIDNSVRFFTAIPNAIKESDILCYRYQHQYASDPILFYLKLSTNEKLKLFQSTK